MTDRPSNVRPVGPNHGNRKLGLTGEGKTPVIIFYFYLTRIGVWNPTDTSRYFYFLSGRTEGGRKERNKFFFFFIKPMNFCDFCTSY